MTDLEIKFADAFADSVHDMGVTLYMTTEVERFPAEPYSHGLSRGVTTEASAHLLHVKIGGLNRLLDAAGDPHIKLAIILMVTTAGRIGALLELTWDRVDMDRRIIRLATNDIGPKKGRATVPINDTLMAALQTAHSADVSDYVIEWGGRKVGSIKTGFNAAVKRAGIEHCTPHDLRRTAGRFMAEAGVPIEEIAQYLGHSNPNVTRSTYSRFSPEYLRKAASALDLGVVNDLHSRRMRERRE